MKSLSLLQGFLTEHIYYILFCICHLSLLYCRPKPGEAEPPSNSVRAIETRNSMFDDNDGDDLEERKYMDEFIGEDDLSLEEDMGQDSNLGIDPLPQNNGVVRTLPFTRQGSSISSTSQANASAVILNPGSTALPVVRRGTRTSSGASNDVQLFGKIMLQNMMLSQARWEEEREERAEERARREEERLNRDRERESARDNHSWR